MKRKISPKGAIPRAVRLALERAINRCQSTRAHSRAAYLDRGVTVAPEWTGDEGSLRFFEHIGPMPGPGYTLGRIDNTRGYEPGNVRWETWTEQQNNRRSNVRVTAQGKTLTLAQWARETGIDRQLITTRRNRGWAMKVAVTTPAGIGKEDAHVKAGIPPARATVPHAQRMRRSAAIKGATDTANKTGSGRQE